MTLSHLEKRSSTTIKAITRQGQKVGKAREKELVALSPPEAANCSLNITRAQQHSLL
jgi:hypothetical protein